MPGVGVVKGEPRAAIVAAAHIQARAQCRGGSGAHVGGEDFGAEDWDQTLIDDAELAGPVGPEIWGMQKPLCYFEHVGAEAGYAGLVRPRIPGAGRVSEHALEAEPVARADLLAVGRELAERIAAPGQERQHAPLVIEGKIGKVTPPRLGMGDGVGASFAGRFNDECVEERHFLLSKDRSAEHLLVGDYLRAGPPDPGK